MAEIHLWRSVIAQAFDDACSSIDMKMPRRPSVQNMRNMRFRIAEAQRDRQEARDWLLVDVEDFTTVCNLALLDPDAVRDAATALCQDEWPTWRMPNHVIEPMEAA
jgi:hypothetical protein